jgi:hypothetical protein
MRQLRHTTAYTPSWQASGNRAAPHRHSGEINAPDRKKPRPFSLGAPILTLPPNQHQPAGKVTAAVCGTNRRPTAGPANARCPLRLSRWGATSCHRRPQICSFPHAAAAEKDHQKPARVRAVESGQVRLSRGNHAAGIWSLVHEHRRSGSRNHGSGICESTNRLGTKCYLFRWQFGGNCPIS